MRYNVAIIGSGVGGYPAAIYLARKGLRVAVFEENMLGGECTNYGCIPSKAFYQVAEAIRTIDKIRGDTEYKWGDLVEWAKSVVKNSRNGIEYLLEKNGVDILYSRALLKGRSRIVYNDGDIEADKIVLDLGTDPKPLPGIGFDGEKVISNREVFYLDRKPDKIIVVGGGTIGVEASYALSKLGVEVELVETEKHILPFLDRDAALTVKRFLSENGVEIHEGITVNRVEPGNKGVVVTLSNGEKHVVDNVLVAIGRKPKTNNVGLELAGIETDRYGFVKVNKHNQTNNPDIYAVGDVVGGPLLAHKAILEGLIAAKSIVNEEVQPLNYHLIPLTIFSGLEVAVVGYTEKELRQNGIRYRKVKLPLSFLSAVKIKDSIYSFIKVLMGENNEIYGLTIVSPLASEVVSAFMPLILNHVGIEETARIPYPHLTVSEALRDLSEYLLGEPIHVFLKK